jgi:pimeloyl-ACP methyl ester carboxylesterase
MPQGDIVRDARPAVVLLHSSMSSRSQWAPLMAAQEARFRFIALDLLGYGKSAFPSEVAHEFSLAHEVDAMAAALAAHLEAGEPFHLVGHSYGGATALRLARQLRSRVLSLAVFEPVAFHLLSPQDPARIGIERVIAAIDMAPSQQAAARVFIDYWNGPGGFDKLPPALQQRFASQVAKVRLDFQALLGEPAALADMHVLNMPALVLRGEQAPTSTRRVADCLAAALPNATARQTPGGHMAPLTHPDDVNRVITGFLNDAAREHA